MAEYGADVSFGQSCTYDKERIRKAMQGLLVTGETNKGFEYEKATPEDCLRFVLDAYEEVVYQARQAMVSNRVLERMLVDNMAKSHRIDFQKYMIYFGEEVRKFDEECPYSYESDE